MKRGRDDYSEEWDDGEEVEAVSEQEGREGVNECEDARWRGPSGHDGFKARLGDCGEGF